MRKRDQFQTSVFKENALCKVKASGQLPSFKIFQQVQLVHTIKTSFITIQTVDPGICLILGFYKSLELVSSRHFVHNFSRNLFLMSYSINCPNPIAWLLLLLGILGNMCIVMICCPVCDVTDFEINDNFRIKPVFYITKKSGQKCNHLKTKKSF